MEINLYITVEVSQELEDLVERLIDVIENKNKEEDDD